MKRHRRGRPPHPDVLTPAEWRVLEHVREGRPNAEIAVRLGVSVATVNTHVSSILAKTGASDRRALAEWEGRPTSVERRAAHALALPFLGRGTKEALMSALKVAGLAAGALVAVVAVLVGFAVFSDGGGADDGVVAVIEGIDVTEEEWEEALAGEFSRNPMTVCLRQMVETMDHSETADIRTTLEFMDRLETGHSREARALGGLLLSLAPRAEAERRGLEPSDEQIAAQVTMTRQMATSTLSDGTADSGPGSVCYRRQVESDIARYGEERYWNEIVPEQQRRSLLLTNLSQAEDEAFPFGGPYFLQLARSADVELSEALEGVVTLDEAYAYLDHSEQLTEQYADGP